MNQPLVTVGFPVFNGEEYLKFALDSLLNQTYNNLEIIISDNASSDSTESICREYVKKDKRIRYSRNLNNIGAARNFYTVLEQASGKYFMWAAHDDLWHPSYIEKCVCKLEENPSYVLCLSNLIFIDKNGKEIGSFETIETKGKNISENFKRWMSRSGGYDFYGLYRKKSIENMRIKESFGSDLIWVLELMLSGEFAKLDESLFYYRVMPKSIVDYAEAIASDTKGKLEIKTFPYCNLIRNIYRVIEDSKLDDNLKTDLAMDFLNVLINENKPMLSEVIWEILSVIGSGFENEGHLKEFIYNIITTDYSISEIQNNLQQKNTNITVKKRFVFIWGAGNAGRKMLSYLNEHNISINGFIDSDLSKCGKDIEGTRIFSPEILDSDLKVAQKPFIFIASTYSDEIKTSLINREYVEFLDFSQALMHRYI